MMRSHLKLVMPVQDDDTPDDVLVSRAQRGDRSALGELVARHQRALFALCMRYVHDADEAADLVQRSFMRAMTKLGELREAGSFRSWILRIGAHLALNHLRDNARFVSDGGDEDRSHAQPGAAPPALAPPALDRLEAAEQATQLRELVSTLPTKQRMTLELRIYEDLSFREIATALEISEGAAKVNFHYAVRKLRAVLGPDPDGSTRHGSGR
jgi:RNA polymerase sigma-70 factor, ECF subfamily